MSHNKSKPPSLTTIESAFIKIVSEITGKQVTAEMSLNSLGDIGIDSLGVMQAICEMEQLFGLSITDDAFHDEDITISQLAQRIQALIVEHPVQTGAVSP